MNLEQESPTQNAFQMHSEFPQSDPFGDSEVSNTLTPRATTNPIVRVGVLDYRPAVRIMVSPVSRRDRPLRTWSGDTPPACWFQMAHCQFPDLPFMLVMTWREWFIKSYETN